ncbi:MAG: uracil-DNA glycosylase [Lentisphaeria bacterium]|nr:uracil-DNA glycosylase [Lentisphaeria bacterium]
MDGYIPDEWLNAVTEFISVEDIEKIVNSSLELRKNAQIYPPRDLVFNALELTALSDVRAVILGQDPYFNEGEAHGLAFSVRQGVKLPPTLKNIFKEYASDLGRSVPESGDLSNWARNGVLLLNAVLTVEAGKPASHAHLNWQHLTDAVIRAVNKKTEPVTFILWGNYAIEKQKLISSHHNIITSPHPSPLAAYRGFFGSRPFSRSQRPDWSWPEL